MTGLLLDKTLYLRRTLALALTSLLLVTVAAVALAERAHAAFGDDYGILDINDGIGPLEDAPAIPGSSAFWAGTCDLFGAPPAGQPLAGGVGTRPTTVLTGVQDTLPNFGAAQVQVPAPTIPDHCIDYGAQTLYQFQSTVWQEIPYLFTSQFGSVMVNSPAGDYAPSWRLPAARQAGARPDGTTMFAWKRNTEGVGQNIGKLDGGVDNIVVDLPPGFTANPNATPKCPSEQFDADPMLCPPNTQLGILRLNIEGVPLGGANLGGGWDTTYPVYNLVPRHGRPAEVGFAYTSGEPVLNVRLEGKARTNGDFGVTAFIGQIPAALSPIAQSITLWGVPWAASNDLWRTKLGHFDNAPCKQQAENPGTNAYIPPSGLAPACREPYDSSWGPIKPFFATQTECDGSDPVVTLRTDSYQNQGAFTDENDPVTTDPDWKTYTSASPSVTGCDKVQFDPDIDFQPTTTVADGPAGMSVNVEVPQNNDPPPAVATNPSDTAGAPAFWKSDDGLATSHLDSTVVTLPEGMRVNPAGATGLEACSDDTIGVRQPGNPPLFDNSDPTDGLGGDDCPNGSKIGTVTATTPLLDEPLTGDFVLGQPETTKPQGEVDGRRMFRVFLVLRDKERGLIAKVYGTSVADPLTGQLTATFDNNPRVPVENIEVDFKGGDRGLFAMPRRCAPAQSRTVFSPWSQAHLDPADQTPTEVLQDWVVDQDCDFGFGPGLGAGMSNAGAGQGGTFSFELTRPQGDQWVSGLTARLPQGLLASTRGFPLCTSAQAATGVCPEASRIGSVDAAAGSGTPFVLEEKGAAYLTEGYKGGPYGLLTRVRAVAGPFRGAFELDPIVVRQAIHVDRRTAQVTAVSDPLPTIWHGVPLGVRRITVNVDRPGFMRNPTDCSAKQVEATLTSDQGATATPAAPFHATGCAGLPFKPKLAMRLTGKKQTRTGGHPGVRAQVTQKPGEAGIERAEVRLPLALALDPDNAQALCEFVDGTKPDLESHCPKGSIVGRARAVSPLLNDPLVGNVYFVKNVRTDPKTGNQIRTLPMIVVALRGEIAVNLRGESDVKRRKLVSTFASVPDAPVDRFNLNINGGRNGILVVTRNRRGGRISLCRGKQVAEADMDGHNGKRHDRDIRMKTPCKKRAKSRRR
jgi:hypothetical protein